MGLAERMGRDEHVEHTRGEVALRWSAVFLVSALVFSGLYFVIYLIE